MTDERGPPPCQISDCDDDAIPESGHRLCDDHFGRYGEHLEGGEQYRLTDPLVVVNVGLLVLGSIAFCAMVVWALVEVFL